jgi:hypothetical protein
MFTLELVHYGSLYRQIGGSFLHACQHIGVVQWHLRLFFSIGALDARLAIRPLAVRAYRGFEKHLGIRVDVHTIFYPLAAQMSFVERQGRRPEGVKTN